MPEKKDHLKRRVKFVQDAINNPKRAGELLIQYGEGLKECKNTTDVIYALKEVLFVCERTVLRDINTDI